MEFGVWLTRSQLLSISFYCSWLVRFFFLIEFSLDAVFCICFFMGLDL